ncbi:hypothetical protein HOY80DRAFT_1112395 [Tuber brumale]|nr:hypothetical protein HOY80DRAFT_1112395 [Tuber brumale]
MAGAITIENVGDITPGTIFLGHSTLPSHPQPKRRPFLALWKVGNQVISLPLTSLQNGGGSVQVAAERFGRSTASYYPITPESNPPYLPVTATQNFRGFIDLLTPVTIGQSSLGKKKTKATKISATDLRSVIMAHVGLVQCGQEEVSLARQEEQPEMLLIDRRTHDNMRQMALGMLQSSEEGLLHARRTQEVTKSLVEAFDRPPAAKLVLPRLQNPTPSLSSSPVDQPPPPPPQTDTQRRQPGQRSSGQQQQQQQLQQPLSSQSGPVSCRPGAPPGGPRNPDNGGGDDGSSGTHHPRSSSNSYSALTGTAKRNRTTTRVSGSSGNQGVQHQKEHQQEECQQEGEYHHNKDSNNEEDEIDEWTRDDWELVEKQAGEDSDSSSTSSEWDLADWDKLEGIIPENTPTEKCGQCHTTATASPVEVYRTPTCESAYSHWEGDQSDCNSEVPQGNTAIPHPLLSPPLQEGQEEPPSKDTSDEHDRRSNKSSPDQHQQHQRNFLPASLPTQPQRAQSQFTNFTHALRRITARAQLHQEATSVPPVGGGTGSKSEDTHPPDISPRDVATTQATQTTTPEQAPTMEPKISGPETSPIPTVRPSKLADARGEWGALLESHSSSAAAEGKGKGKVEVEVEENKQKVVEEEYKVYQELQRILSNACKSSLRQLGVSEDSLWALEPKNEVSFRAYRSSFSSLISEDSAHEDNSIGRFLAALDRGQSLQAEIAAEMAAAGGRLSGGLLMEYVDVAREICQPHDDSSREIDELCARAEIALGSGSSATAAATAESSNWRPRP